MNAEYPQKSEDELVALLKQLADEIPGAYLGLPNAEKMLEIRQKNDARWIRKMDQMEAADRERMEQLRKSALFAIKGNR